MAVYNLFPFPSDHQASMFCFLKLVDINEVSQQFFVILFGDRSKAVQGKHGLGQPCRGQLPAAFEDAHGLVI